MRSLVKYFIVLASLVAALASCGTEGNKPNEWETVPEGVLRVFADKQAIAADGTDCVTFKVMFGAKDVSSEKTMNLVWTSGDKEVALSDGANVFSTTAPGTYTFKATLYSGGNHVSDNEVVITASEVSGQKRYFQRVIGEQFTSVGCTNCPVLSTNIKTVQERMPGVMIPLSFHQDYGMTDPMSVTATELFYKAYGFSGLPFFNLNMHKVDGGVAREVESIIKAINDELELYPTTCGVAIETTYDSATRELVVQTKITSNVGARYKYHIFLVEDGIVYSQSGVTGDYTHNNVVRKMFATDITGLNINKKAPLTPGVEVVTSNKTTLERGWNTANMRVVVIAMSSNDGDKTYFCNNANECPVGGSVDYILNE